MIESIVTAVFAAAVPLVSDIARAALAGTSSEELVSHARRAVRDYHAARPEGRAAMRAAWGDLGDALWGPRAYVGDGGPPPDRIRVARAMSNHHPDIQTVDIVPALPGSVVPPDTLPGAPAFDYPDDLPPGEQGPDTRVP